MLKSTGTSILILEQLELVFRHIGEHSDFTWGLVSAVDHHTTSVPVSIYCSFLETSFSYGHHFSLKHYIIIKKPQLTFSYQYFIGGVVHGD